MPPTTCWRGRGLARMSRRFSFWRIHIINQNISNERHSKIFVES